MKAITIWQPWASLIAEGVKTIETRGREHPWRSAIGQRIAIHAALGERWREGQAFGPWLAYRSSRTHAARIYNSDRIAPLVRPLPLGAVLATCTLDAVVPIIDVETQFGPTDHDAYRQAVYVLRDALELTDRAVCIGDAGHTIDVTDQRPVGDFTAGRWALLLADIRPLREPEYIAGHQGLWEWDEMALGEPIVPLMSGGESS